MFKKKNRPKKTREQMRLELDAYMEACAALEEESTKTPMTRRIIDLREPSQRSPIDEDVPVDEIITVSLADLGIEHVLGYDNVILVGQSLYQARKAYELLAALGADTDRLSPIHR